MTTRFVQSRLRAGVGIGCAAILALSGVVLAPPVASAAPQPEEQAAPDGELAIVPDTLVSVTPARFVDTRSGAATVDGQFAGSGKRAADTEFEITVAGRDAVPADAAAVVVNVTAVDPDDRGYVTLHPCVSPRPLASSLNFVRDVNTGNEIVAALSGDGSICAYTNSSTHLTIDVVGYVPATGEISPIVPARLLDTRPAATTVDGVGSGAGRTTPGSSLTVPVAGRGGVPASDVHSVLVNVTAVNAQDRGFVVVHGCLPTVPSTSSLNHVAGVNRGNELLVELSADGEICLFTNRSIHLTVDVVSYILDGSTVAPIAPSRLADSRPAGVTVDGADAGFGTRPGGSEYTLQVTGRAGVPADAQAAVVNLTAVAPTARGYITVHPCVSPRPLASSLNYVAGVNGANELIAGLSAGGELCIFTNMTTDFVVDIVGYLADSAAPMADLSITKSDSVDPVIAGNPLTYTVTVSNAGPADAENVRVTDELPDGVTLVSTTGCDNDPAGVPECQLGDIAAGTSKQFTITSAISIDTASSTVTNSATVAADTADPDGGNNTAQEDTTIQGVGTISIVKASDPAGGTGFVFTDDIPGSGSFTLDDAQTKTITNVPAGSYIVTEGDPTPGFTLTGLICVDSDAGGTASTTVLATRVASINLDPGETVTCTYTNTFNAAPTITSADTQSAAENQTAVATLTATDPDVPAQTLTFSITGGADAALFGITAGGVLTFNGAPDFENPTDTGGDGVYDVQVTVTDNGTPNLTDVQDIAVTVTDVNDAPVITSDGGGATAAVNAAENQTAVTTVNATDEDLPAQTLTRTITGGADQALFGITAGGILTFNTAPDFENPTDTGGDGVYDVQVTVTDNGTPNLTDVQDIAVTVTDVEPETPPTGIDDPYNATGNVSITVPLASGVLSNDTGTTLTVSEVQGVPANVGVATDTAAVGLGGVTGSVTLEADGSFTYRPPPGYVGADTFTYEVANGAGSDTATVTITVADMIWFVDNTSAGANRGTLDDPFTSITSLNTAQGAASPNPTDGQTIFVDTGTGTYTDGAVLRSGQQLIGEAATLPIATIAGLTLAPFSDTLPATSGPAPVLTDTVAGANGIDLSSDNVVRGLDIGNTGGVGLNSTANAGTLTVSEVAISGTGGGVDILGGGSDAIVVILDDLSSSSVTEYGIRLQSVGGIFSVLGSAGTVTTAAVPAVEVISSSTTVTYDGTVVANTTAANGINLTNNVGGTITLGGRLDIDTTSGTGFNATGGGTVVANGPNSDIDTTTGVGVNIVDTTIGGAGPSLSGTDLTGAFGATFQSVSVGTGTTGPASGIVLDNVGVGGFTITGAGGTDGSGGTLQDTTADAIVLLGGTTNVELTNIVVDDIGRHGVFGTGAVTNLVVNDSQFTDIGNANGEEAFSFDSDTATPLEPPNIAGQLTLNDVDITRYFDNGLNIYAESGNVDVDVINGTDFVDGADSPSMGQAIIVETEGTAGVDLNVTGSLFDDVETDAVRFEAGGSGTNNADVMDNDVTDPGGPDNVPNGGSFNMIVTDAATLNFDIQGNTQNDLPGDGILVSASSGGGNISGRIGGPNLSDGNTINGGVDPFGFPVSDGIYVSDIGVDATIAETMTLLIQNNTIDAGGGDDGIQFAVGDSNGDYDVTIRGNTITDTGSEGIRFFLDDDLSQSPTLDLDVTDNSFTMIGDGAIELATRDAAIACADYTGNSDGAAGSPGTILFDERDASAISVPQASLPAVAAVNNAATVTVLTNPITFNSSCATILPSHP